MKKKKKNERINGFSPKRDCSTKGVEAIVDIRPRKSGCHKKKVFETVIVYDHFWSANLKNQNVD